MYKIHANMIFSCYGDERTLRYHLVIRNREYSQIHRFSTIHFLLSLLLFFIIIIIIIISSTNCHRILICVAHTNVMIERGFSEKISPPKNK